MKNFVKFLTMISLVFALSFSSACALPDKNKTDSNGSGEGKNSKPNDEPTYRTEAEEVEKINENSTFELKFLEDVREKDLSEFICHPGFGVSGYSNAKYGDTHRFSNDIIVQYDVTAYPDYADGGSFVTSIYCSDPEVTFYGGYTIASGDSFADELDAAGYSIVRHSSSVYGVPSFTATRGNIRISYILNHEFYILYNVSNRDGIMF